MSKTVHFLTLLVLLLSGSCHVQEQMQSFKRIISPAGNGNVDSTLILMDSIPQFKNPLINLKYKHTKKAYHARFIEKNEKNKDVTKNVVINEICAIYHSYWNLKLINSPINADSILYDRIAHYLVDKRLTALSYTEIRPTVQNDEELSKVITNEGFYARFLYLNEIQDILIWEEQEERQYTIALPNDELVVDVVFIDKYANSGCLDYATFGMAQIGGWAASDSPKLFCNKASYKLNSEKFKVSYLKHEALHFIDMRSYPNLEAADLEYRSKLVELMYASKKTIYHLMYQFIVGGSNETRNNSHAYANYSIHHHFSQAIFEKDFETDLKKWKEVPVEQLNTVSTKLFNDCTEKLKANPALARIL